MPWSLLWKRKSVSQKITEDTPEDTPQTAPKGTPEKEQLERIKLVAYELYQNREKGSKDAQSDFDMATRIVQSRWRGTLFALNRPFIKFEKKLLEPFLAWADSLALLSLLGLASNVGLIIAVATYVGSEKQRRDAEILNAWQTLTSAHGQVGNGGRKRALEFLNASPGANWRRKFPWFCAPRPICVWPGESLAGIDLSAGPINVAAAAQEDLSPQFFRPKEELGRVYLAEIQLPKADLKSANLQDADLSRANLQDAVLWGANLQGVVLNSANLQDAELQSAKLQNAELAGTELQGANLGGTYLTDADLSHASLRGSDLKDADLKDASLLGARLQDASLWGANLQGAVLNFADLRGANLNNANLQGAELGRVDLQGTYLTVVDFQSTFLWGANLQGTYLADADLQDADLSRANLQDAVLWGANLQGANLGSANLRDANLKSANLQGVFLGRANLQDDVPEDYELRRALSARRNTILNGDESQVELESANLQGVSLEGADLQDAIFLSIDLRETRNLSLEALESDNPPLICNSPLPSDIEIKGGKDRDCDQLAIVLSERYPHFFNSLEDAETFIKEQREKTWK